MREKLRRYTRELTESEIKKLKTKHKSQVKPPRDGFLNTDTKKLLLHISNWSDNPSDREIYDFFYEIRERAKSAIFDMQLLCDVLTENQLQTVFGTKRYKPQAEDLYPISELLNAITSEEGVKGSSKKKEQLRKDREWRKLVLEDLVVRGLSWYYSSGVFKTDLHRRLIKDTIDTLQITSSGELKPTMDSTESGMI